ncbi:DEAD/DEAH box helicase [Amphibiibacter pelophylacis]|uniref:DEAD/DEAH box helicase n=1 Tax=Amphibiibacter pelophylacis TaxID=1799477 RepID=A0ACC6P385_9BURK
MQDTPQAIPEIPAPPSAPLRFDAVGLDAKLVRAVHDQGYSTMTPIQAAALPVVLAGRDMMGAAQTGTGKTAAFSLPLLQRMLRHETSSASPARHPVRALILTPTRELADQVAQNVAAYARHTQLRSLVVYGGIDMKPQAMALRQGVEIVIATPGRLLDHLQARNCSLAQVEFVVLDEADRMLDIGFLPDLQRILSHLPKQRQTLLFSATFSGDIKKLAQSYLQSPQVIEVARPNATATKVTQRFIKVDEDFKHAALVQMVRDENLTQAIVFVNSKLGAARLARALERDGLVTAALHGDKSQDERTKALDAFKRGEVHLLVATDVAARGLDVADLPAVFNYDVPFHAEDYVHRIGRTGRAGAEGLAVTLVSVRDERLIGDLEKLLKKPVEWAPFEVRGLPRHRPAFEATARPRRDDSAAPPRRHDAPGAAARSEAPAWRPRPAPSDPFFDQPYREPERSEPAAWERTVDPKAALAQAAQLRNRLSPNIRTRRKLPALFVAPAPEMASDAPATV